MSIYRIYPSKSNTVASGPIFELLNSSQAPVTSLWYGGGLNTGLERRNSISRHMVQFDLTELARKLSTLEINPAYVTAYRLKFKNAIPNDTVLTPEYEFDILDKNIASSFDLMAFQINKSWDENRGNDLSESKFLIKQHGNPLLSGCSNWLSATTLSSWDEPGIFTNPSASTAMFATQHFALGNEDLNMDVTHMVKNWLSGGSTNNGFGICYTRPYEAMSADSRYIASFYTHKTNSAFKPFLEVEYVQNIEDDRMQAVNNRITRLFLYTFSGNTPVNYYSAGTVTIKNSAGSDIYTGLVPVHHSLGAYYIDVWMSGTTKGQKFKDVWNNVTFVPGYDQQNFTQSFEIRDNFYTSNAREINEYVVTTYGISNNDILQSGEIRRIYAETRVNYSTAHPTTDYGLEYRLTMNNNTEVIPWTKMHNAIINGCLKCYLDIDTSWLLNNQTYEINMRINELGTKKNITERVVFRMTSSFSDTRI